MKLKILKNCVSIFFIKYGRKFLITIFFQKNSSFSHMVEKVSCNMVITINMPFMVNDLPYFTINTIYGKLNLPYGENMVDLV